MEEAIDGNAAILEDILHRINNMINKLQSIYTADITLKDDVLLASELEIK